MANTIALIIFCVGFVGLLLLILKKIPVLAALPEEAASQDTIKIGQTKRAIFQKTDFIKQAVLSNGKIKSVVSKTTGGFKTILANRIITSDDLEKAAKIHQEGDYWQKIEEHKLPEKKKTSRRAKIKIIQAQAAGDIEIEPVAPKVKKSRTRKKKAE